MREGGVVVVRPLCDELRRRLSRDLQAEKLLHLPGEDDDRDAGGEPGGHRVGDELDHGPELERPEDDEDDAGHQRGQDQPLVAELVDHAGDDDDEGPGRPADLHAAPAQQRYQKPRDDRGIKPLLGAHVRGDGKGDRQRQRDHPDRHPGQKIAQKKLLAIPFAQANEALGNKRLAGEISPGGRTQRGHRRNSKLIQPDSLSA